MWDDTVVSELPSVMVTGANGFVGRALCAALRERGYPVTAAMRSAAAAPAEYAACSDRVVSVGDIGPGTDWREALEGVDVVIHLAARVHMMKEQGAGGDLYHQVNALGTEHLAECAAAAGVRRMIFLSSIKVNGESTDARPFSSSSVPAPLDPYGCSKLEGEVRLKAVAARTGMECVVIRPPLVYGPGVKANFRAMVGWLYRRIPLPLGAIDNRRSLIALDNLVDLIITCIRHPAAPGRTFLVSDGEDVSTPELLRRMARALGRSALLLPVPVSLLSLAATLVGRAHVLQRLAGSLQVDGAEARQVLGWEPPLSLDAGLRQVAEEYLRECGGSR